MENKFKRFIIVQRPNGLEKYVMNHGATYNLIPDREYIPVIEYAALESANAEFEKYRVDMAALYRDETGKCYNTISDLKSENAKLADETAKLLEENTKLRAALERIDSRGLVNITPQEIARKALENLK